MGYLLQFASLCHRCPRPACLISHFKEVQNTVQNSTPSPLSFLKSNIGQRPVRFTECPEPSFAPENNYASTPTRLIQRILFKPIHVFKAQSLYSSYPGPKIPQQIPSNLKNSRMKSARSGISSLRQGKYLTFIGIQDTFLHRGLRRAAERPHSE